MMNKKIAAIGLLIVGQSCLTSCTYVKTLFPDKEKDYQFTTEIAPLTIPADLQEKAAPAVSASPRAAETDSAATAAEAATAAPVPGEPAAIPEAIPADSAPVAATPEAEPEKPVTVQLIKADDDQHLLVGAALNKTWRLVDKALSRKSVEVTKRDQDGGLFTVQYDPQEQVPKDESMWDELKFIFSGLGTHEKQMTLYLASQGDSTEVSVIDAEQKPINDEHSLSLLNLLYNAIQTDLANTNTNKTK